MQYLKLLAGLVDSFHPRTLGEMTMIEDIAQLHWQRRRNQIARGARVALAVERLELERAELQRRTEQEPSLDVAEEEIRQKGLRGIADSPAKYQKMLGALENLLDLAKKKDFGKARYHLDLLYGRGEQQAKTRGKTIRDFFRCLEKGRVTASGPKEDFAEAASPGELRRWRQALRGIAQRGVRRSARGVAPLLPAARGNHPRPARIVVRAGGGGPTAAARAGAGGWAADPHVQIVDGAATGAKAGGGGRRGGGAGLRFPGAH